MPPRRVAAVTCACVRTRQRGVTAFSRVFVRLGLCITILRPFFDYSTENCKFMGKRLRNSHLLARPAVGRRLTQTLHMNICTEIGKKYANLAKQDPGRAGQNR